MDSPETFAEKVNEICTVYHETKAICATDDHSIFVDKITGIQALEHKYSDNFVIPEKVTRMKFEYIRHGMASLIGSFDISTGRMEPSYLNPTCTETDFVDVTRTLIEIEQRHHGCLSIMD